ncbi:MAG: polymerase primary sigma factor [Gaiellales bacterium]|nr:polymerase primary sigma factor [Gaiellales bacterium]
MLIALGPGCRLRRFVLIMDGFGFHFRYCISGSPPATRGFAQGREQGLVPGDMVSLVAGVPALAATGDVSFLGAVSERVADPEPRVDVVVTHDAVYGVADRHARSVGASLDLAGGSGLQTVSEPVNNDFEVVADSTADQETLLRIGFGRHYDSIVRAEAGQAIQPPTALTPARERQLVLASVAGEPRAREQLVEAFLPAIAGVARLYRNVPMVDRTELLQEGVVGLLRAARRFDPSLGTPFWAYAGWSVRQAMQQLVSELTRPAVLSDRAQRALAQVRETRRGYLQDHGREPTTSELAALVALSREQVESLLAVERAPQPLQISASDSNGQQSAGDMLADPTAEQEYERIISRLEIERIRDLTRTLTAREREILNQHYGLEGPAKTLREIGEELGISAERVRQIEERSLEKLRDAVLGTES